MALKIYNWTAKRAGAFITINGYDEDGRPCKRTRVTSIVGEGGRILATQEFGVPTELVPIAAEG